MGITRKESYVARCGSKNGYQKDVCVIEIGLFVQNMITIVGSKANMIGENYDHLMSMRIFALMMNKTFIRALKFMRNMAATALIWIY